jgi:ribosomal protein L11 methylase PrmA
MLQPLTRYLAPGGTIILSGLLASQEITMRTAIQDAGLVVQSRRGEEEWVALAVRHARDVEQSLLHV